MNLKRPTLRLTPLQADDDDGTTHHDGAHALEFEFDADAPKAAINVSVVLPGAPRGDTGGTDQSRSCKAVALTVALPLRRSCQRRSSRLPLTAPDPRVLSHVLSRHDTSSGDDITVTELSTKSGLYLIAQHYSSVYSTQSSTLLSTLPISCKVWYGYLYSGGSYSRFWTTSRMPRNTSCCSSINRRLVGTSYLPGQLAFPHATRAVHPRKRCGH